MESAVHVVSLLSPLSQDAQTLANTFHVIVDTVSCIIHYGFDILSNVFAHNNGIIGLKNQLF